MTVTVAAASGSPVCASVTVPVTALCCATTCAGCESTPAPTASRASQSIDAPRLGRDLFMFPSFVLLGMEMESGNRPRAKTDHPMAVFRAQGADPGEELPERTASTCVEEELPGVSRMRAMERRLR